MKKFTAIEGLRGWLAWTVVLSHIELVSAVYAKGLGLVIQETGSQAVLVFVIVSGFVITHLLVERPEPYGVYILRRFMRIFPLFAVTCSFGYFTSDILADVLPRVPWADNPRFIASTLTQVAGVSQSDHEFFWSNALAHLLMIHGAISNRVLPFSELAFNAPAWSLSLEWQFYLLAPLVIPLVRRSAAILWLAIAVAALKMAYDAGVFGSHVPLSFLPGAAQYFYLGIATRLVCPLIVGTVRRPIIILAAIVVLVPLGQPLAPLLIWAIVMTGLAVDRSTPDGKMFAGIFSCLLESRPAVYFGSRSYSVYLCHWPIVGVCLAIWFNAFPSSGDYATFFGVAALAVPATLVTSELLYRSIELPGIALGSRLARRNAPLAVRTPHA